MYYKAVMSDKIFNERSFLILDDIFGPGAFSAWVRAGALRPIESPSVIDLLKNGQHFEAVRRYHEIHEGSTVKESIDMVGKIEADMAKFQKKRTCKTCGFECNKSCLYPAPCDDCSEWVPKYE